LGDGAARQPTTATPYLILLHRSLRARAEAHDHEALDLTTSAPGGHSVLMGVQGSDIFRLDRKPFDDSIDDLRVLVGKDADRSRMRIVVRAMPESMQHHAQLCSDDASRDIKRSSFRGTKLALITSLIRSDLLAPRFCF